MNRIFTRTGKEKTRGLQCFLVFLIISILLPTCFAENTKKCLNDPAPQKRYMRYGSNALSIKLEVSPRITHQLTTHIYCILLRERLGYQAVEIVEYDDDNLDLSIGRLSLEDESYVNSIDAIPTSIVNVEVLVPWSEASPSIYLNDVHDLGTLSPPGQYGWFIPKELSSPVKDKIKGWILDTDVHWAHFMDPYFVQDFDITGKFSSFFETYLDTNAFSHGWYIPPRCANRKCAVLFASVFNNNTNQLKAHIDDMGVYVKVAWVGPHLKTVVDSIRKRILELNVKQSFLIFSWTPSDIVLNKASFINVNMNVYNGKPKDSFYNLQRPVKFAWNGLEKSANIAHDMLNHMWLDEAEFDYLLSLYSKMKDRLDVEDIACEWIKAKKSTWEQWVPEIKNQIIIGGIFPLTGSSYTGIGILRGAQMAVEAVNKNNTILSNYELKVLSTDGSCRADRVMSRFIDYVSEGRNKDLVGILGPACSDTVEPLAGISKYHKTIVISYSAEGALLSDRDKYPYFFRTIGENKNYKHVYLQLLKKMKWSRVYALTEDGQKYTEYISHMRNMLEKNGITVSNTKFPRNRERDVMTRYIDELRNNRARIIIADVFDEVARIVMCEAYKQGMTARQGYVWFLPTWLNTTWYDTDYFNKEMNETVNCTTTVMREAINGYFSIAHAYYANDDDNMQENITVKTWKKNYDSMIDKFHLKPSNYAGYAYDAVWTYALSLDQLIREAPESMADLHSDKTITKLTDIIKHIDFNGVSGRINFRGGPSRFSIINILQWYNNSTRIVGRFHPNISLGMPPEIIGGRLDLNQSAIAWLGGQRPVDGAEEPNECTLNWLAKFLNVQCETAIIILNIFIFCILLICFIFGAFHYKKRYEQQVLMSSEFMKSIGLEHLMTTEYKGLDKWEIARDRVVINRKLGEGAFGTVYGGEASLSESGNAWRPVAVKTLKVGSTTEEKLDFLSEAEVMKRFDHKNIIQLLGVCTKIEPIYTVMEFMLYGDLKTFLLARRHLVNGTTVDDGEEVSSKKLTNMALDVARGLSYLTELKYVHRDIASRNCLVNGNRVVKLADFGMTRPMFENDYYKFNRKGMLPVRWMSPESLALGHFSPNSDIWSFGVLLYEIITFGSFPFQGYSNSQVLELVKNGKTIDIPKGVKPQLEYLLKSCWNQIATERPKASELVEFLANNGRIISPCLDVPLASVTIEDNGQLDWQVSDQSRKCSSSRNSFKTLANGVSSMSIDESPSTRSLRQRQQMLLDDTISTPLENCCPKEPLLPTRSNSLNGSTKFVTIHADSGCEQEESDYCSHVVSNGHAIAVSKV